MLKRLGRTRAAQEGLGAVLASYLGLVRRANRFTVEPADYEARVAADLPVIAAMWHGQHFMTHYAWPKGAKVAALISRHGDAELNAIVLRRLGVRPIRGSGGRAERMHRKGGVVAMREMLRALGQGETIVMTADVPKIEAAVLAIYAGRDERINATIPATEAAMRAAGKTLRKVVYPDTEHAFHNDTGSRYDAAAAKAAWDETLAWLARYLA